ncbi:metal dependent hydrolase of the beta-lactamase superfamily I domain protein, partial [Chlamydia psittaci 84-8471/1]
HTAFAFFRAD